MPNDSTNSMQVKYGEFDIDFAKVPHASLVAMLRRGVSHYFGSEQASKVTGKFKPDEDGSLAEGVIDTPENRAQALAEYRAKALENLLAGTVGISTRGPAVDPITTIVRRLAKAKVTEILRQHKIAVPKKAEDTIETPDGNRFTMAQLVDRRIAKYGEELNKEAKKIADEQARKAKKAAEQAAAEGLGEL